MFGMENRMLAREKLGFVWDNKSRSKLTTNLSGPLCIKTHAIIEGFLGSHPCRRESGVQIGASHCFQFRYAVREEHREAPNEGIAGAAAVDTLYGKGRYVLTDARACDERTVCSQSDDDAANATGHQFLRALFCVFDISYWNASDCCGLALIGNEVIEIGQRTHFNGLSRSWIHDAANAMLSRERNRVVDRLQRDLKLEHDAIRGFQHVSRRVNIRGLQRVVRSLHHQNAVLPVRLDEDRRNAAG